MTKIERTWSGFLLQSKSTLRADEICFASLKSLALDFGGLKLNDYKSLNMSTESYVILPNQDLTVSDVNRYKSLSIGFEHQKDSRC